MSIARRHSTMCSVPFSELEQEHYEKMHDTLEGIRDRVVAEMAVKKPDTKMVETNKCGGLRFRATTGMQQRKTMKLLQRKGFKVVKLPVAGA
jgi:hypothetical protein